MCYPIFAFAFCAVFTPATAHVAPPPAASATVRPAEESARPVAIPAVERVGETAAPGIGLPEGRRGEALPGEAAPRAATATRAPSAELDRTAYAPAHDTEAKGSSHESGAAFDTGAGDTERK